MTREIHQVSSDGEKKLKLSCAIVAEGSNIVEVTCKCDPALAQAKMLVLMQRQMQAGSLATDALVTAIGWRPGR